MNVTRAQAGAFSVEDMTFPPRYRVQPFDPDDAYIAVVLDGSMAKTFARATHELGAASVVTIPAGGRHGTDFSLAGSRVLTVRAPANLDLLDPFVLDVRHLRDGAATALGWRLAGELRARDTAWDLAAEGLLLELLAALARRLRPRSSRPPRWLGSVLEVLHESPRDQPALSEVAARVGVHPSHLARVFREHQGETIGSYVRRLRLEWAAAQLVSTDSCIATIAAEAGFTDQSHFTRVFKRYRGVTPGRFRSARRE